MSTKIVATPSRPLNGEINKDDLHKIYDEYSKHLRLESNDSRHFKKPKGFYIGIDILKEFIKQAEEAGPTYSKIFLQFGVTLPNQTTCYPPHADIANSLIVTLFIADENNKIKDNVGDGVLAAGFKAAQSSAKNKKAIMNFDSAPTLTCCGNPHGG